MVAMVASMKEATGVSSWLVGHGINAVSEIEETARISLVFGLGESSLGARNSLSIVRVPGRVEFAQEKLERHSTMRVYNSYSCAVRKDWQEARVRFRLRQLTPVVWIVARKASSVTSLLIETKWEWGWYTSLPEKEGTEGNLPAFAILDDNWKQDALAKLSVAEAAFGLWLLGSQVTDSELEKLARFKHLHALSLTITKEDGYRAEKPTSLRSLDLSFSGHVTDAGIKTLAGLKQMRTLDIVNTQVTAAGVAETVKHIFTC
jgi:hypothetical protein